MESPRPSVLIACSDAQWREHWVEQVQACGAQAFTAGDRAAWLHGMRERSHALALVDTRPGVEAEWIHAARAAESTRSVPILACCTHEQRTQTLQAGASECLDPQVDLRELAQRLQHNAAWSSAHDALDGERLEHARLQRALEAGSFVLDRFDGSLHFSMEALRLLALAESEAPHSLSQFCLRLDAATRESIRAWMGAAGDHLNSRPLDFVWTDAQGQARALTLSALGVDPLGQGRERLHGLVRARAIPTTVAPYTRGAAPAESSQFLERLALQLSRTKPAQEHFALLAIRIHPPAAWRENAQAMECLQAEISARLLEQTRDRDFFGDGLSGTLAILLPALARPHDAYKVARRLQEELHRPIVHAGSSLQVEATLGIAVAGADGQEAQELLNAASQAEQQARQAQGSGIRFHAAALEASIHERLAIESDLKRAIEQHEIAVYYQPKVDLRSGRLSGFEALARWIHPVRGMISPGQFIPIAEETGLVLPLGEWVLESACRQAEAWRREGLSPVRMAVNLSGLHFRAPDLVGKVDFLLRSTGLPAELLEIELTESSLLQHGDATLTRLQQLKRMGVRLSIDDFGTGYSSLAYLKRFPVDALKIDQAFVRDLMQDPYNSAITSAILLIGKALDLKVVAEGIETRAQLDLLKALDCDEGQGYFFGKPVPADEARKLVEAQIMFRAA